MSSPRRLPWIPVLALLAALVGGCGRAPNAPVVTEPALSSSVAKPAASETGLIGDLVGGLVRVLNLVGSVGGSLTNGRWRVDIPAGAVDGDGRVTLAVRESSSSDCSLEIYPLELNHFDTPVTLTASCPSVSSRELRDYVIFWFDPSTRRWVELDSEVDLTTKTVRARLQHFSVYSCGPKGSKASW